MNIVATGLMAGMNTDEYIQGVVDFAADRGEKVRVFDVFDRLQNRHHVSIDKLLQMNDHLFREYRRSEYLRIALEMERDDTYDHTIVKTHSTARLESLPSIFRDARYVAELKPDMLVTLIDAEWLIDGRIQKEGNKNDAIHNSYLGDTNDRLKHILEWIHMEVNNTEAWARQLSQPDERWGDFLKDYVIATGQPPESLYKFMKDPNVPVFYASYSMTHASDEVREEVNEAIAGLRPYGVVVDPQAIEIGLNVPPGPDKDATYEATVERDLQYIVKKLKQGTRNAVVAFHPYTDVPPQSTGMCDELGTARDYGIDRFLVMPKGKSPFTTHSYASRGWLFDTKEELFEKMESAGYKKLEL